ncbi:MAG: queuosine precursor transporter [Anaerolineales bacterium]|nr:queuosine precursor transporter [Anaerolineales bacterium]
METKNYRYFDVILGLFIAVLLVSNIASSAKIIDLGFSIFKIPMAFDAGTLLFPIGYVFGDILTEVYGYQRSRRVIWMGFFSLALAAVVFWIISVLPGEVTWQGYAGDAAYQSILGGMSTGGIVFGSLAGFWLGEFANSFTLAKMKILTNGRWLWSRTIGSTLVGELVDTVMFVAVASAFGVFPWSLFLTLTVANYLFKVTVEALMTPLTYAVVGALKKAEREDYYDRDTDFNPFVMQ